MPASRKLLALGIGLGLTGMLVVLEVPIESVVGFLLPVFGIVADGMVDGLELLVLPVLLACLLLPHLAKGTISAQ